MLLLLLLDVFTSAEEETASLEGPHNDGMMHVCGWMDLRFDCNEDSM